MCNYEERYINFREVFNDFYAAERLQNSIYIFGDLVSLLSDGRTALFAVKRMKNDLAYIRKADFKLSVLEGELLLNSAANVPSIPPTGYDYPLDILLPELRRISKKVRWDKDELDMDWDKEANFIEDDGSIRESFGPVAEYTPLVNDRAYNPKGGTRAQIISTCTFSTSQDLVGAGFCLSLSLMRSVPTSTMSTCGESWSSCTTSVSGNIDTVSSQGRICLSSRRFQEPDVEAEQKDPNPAVWVEKKSDTRSLLENELQQVLYDIENEVRPEITSREIVDLREIFSP